MKRKAVFAGIFVIAILATRCERCERNFATGKQALASEAARRGWIPNWLPARAREVQIEFDLDTNERWLSFKIEPSASLSVVENLERLSEEAIRELRIRKPHANWWFEGLIQQQPSNDGALNAEVFAGAIQGEKLIVLRERESERVFVYFHAS